MNKTIKKEEGFTIIEVVLVLAIAALIMLLVFLALPALQRGQRDTQRKNDVGRLQAAISNYKARNNGRVPAPGDFTKSQNNFFDNELRRANDTFADPVGGNYKAVVRTAIGSQETYGEPESSNIYLYYGARCNGEEVTGSVTGSGARRIVIVKPLEGGGRQCQEA